MKEIKEININNYIFDKPLTSDNSGFAKWGLGKRGMRTYFVKEFLSPTYPADSSIYTEKQMADKKRLCDMFVKSKMHLYNAIREASDGNLVAVEQFFRVGSKYYISTNAIRGRLLSVDEVFFRPFPDRLRICCSIAHSMLGLHSEKIVHADIKPDNIMITLMDGKIVPQAKIIDFDCSFFEEEAPKLGEELNGDMVYLSPEGFLHIAGIESNLSCKMDIFALGILFHQYLTGKLPTFDTTEYQYAYEAVLDGHELGVEEIGNIECREMVAGMLQREPSERPECGAVFALFNEILLRMLNRPHPEKLYDEKPLTAENTAGVSADTSKKENPSSGGFFYTPTEL